MQRLILASGSANRKALLASIHIPFTMIPSHYDELSYHESDPRTRALFLAKAKGDVVAKTHAGVIISADTYTVCDGKILEKPVDHAEAKTMLRMLSGRDARDYTGFYYLDRENNITAHEIALTDITFREIAESEIEQIIKIYPVTTWAAAYAIIDPYQMSLVKSISGSLTGLTHGLPMELLIPLLKRSGFSPNP